MSRRSRPTHENDVRQLLVDKGMRVTVQRMAILKELVRLRVPTSHSELTEQLAGPGLDRVTIYRNLLALTEAGLLVRTRLGDNVWRFELPRTDSTEHHAHPHFVCNDCGEVVCLPRSAVALRAEAARNHVAEIQLRGRCADCVGE